MKATRKLIPALAMLIVSAVVMSSASFAWFTMSRQVTATGIDVSVTAPNNLLIKGNDSGDTWGSAADTNVSATLVPASTPATTNKGEKFYVVSEGVNGLVDANSGHLLADTELEDGVENSAYVDYKFKVKSDGEATTVYVKDFSIKNKASTKATDPVRFALLEDTDVVGLYNAGKGTNLGDKLAEDTPTITKAVVKSLSSKKALFEAESYIGSFDKSSVYQPDNTTTFAVTKGGETDITIRVWYEGQDSKCTLADAAGANFELTVTLAAVDA